jgi:hypothetical protein
MLHFNESTSPVKSIPGLVSATPTGLAIHAQDVRLRDVVYEIRETLFPVAYDGEDVSIRVAICAGPTGHEVVAIENGATPPGYTEVCELALLRLRSPGDTPETVDVHVPRRTLVRDDGYPLSETPVRHAVSATPVTPAANPERAARRARAAALAPLRSKRVAAMTPAERNILLEAVAQKLGLIDEGAP